MTDMRGPCHRCGAETTTTTMSMFNKDVICVECKEKERAHPQYKAAVRADNDAFLNGDYNFDGIGLPDELRPTKSDILRRHANENGIPIVEQEESPREAMLRREFPQFYKDKETTDA